MPFLSRLAPVVCALSTACGGEFDKLPLSEQPCSPNIEQSARNALTQIRNGCREAFNATGALDGYVCLVLVCTNPNGKQISVAQISSFENLCIADLNGDSAMMDRTVEAVIAPEDPKRGVPTFARNCTENGGKVSDIAAGFVPNSRYPECPKFCSADSLK